MKKILALLLMLSVVAGMTLPAMAKAEAESNSNGGTTAGDLNIDQDASNYAAHSVSVSLYAEPQTNSIGDIIGASGDNTNGAVATWAGSAKAEDANSGKATSGSSGSGATSGSAGASVDDIKDNHDDVNANPEAETGNAKSESDTGDANSGDATNVADVSNNENEASANFNDLTSGNVDNHITQLNTITQITPIRIDNDQKLTQKANVLSVQDASSDPYQLTIAKDKKTEITKTDIDKTETDISFDDSPIEVEL
jgi:hypothetical protein